MTDWRDKAGCLAHNPEMFFPIGASDIRATRAAKAVCGRCQVVTQCLNFATANSLREGVWGGLTEQERESARRRQQRAKAKA